MNSKRIISTLALTLILGTTLSAPASADDRDRRESRQVAPVIMKSVEATRDSRVAHRGDRRHDNRRYDRHDNRRHHRDDHRGRHFEPYYRSHRYYDRHGYRDHKRHGHRHSHRVDHHRHDRRRHDHRGHWIILFDWM